MKMRLTLAIACLCASRLYAEAETKESITVVTSVEMDSNLPEDLKRELRAEVRRDCREMKRKYTDVEGVECRAMLTEEQEVRCDEQEEQTLDKSHCCKPRPCCGKPCNSCCCKSPQLNKGCACGKPRPKN